MWGFLRETKEKAQKDGVDPETGMIKTGLEIYLAVIFPEINDWVHDVRINNKLRIRPDYRSETLKMIVEFDGLYHYTNPIQIIKDRENTKIYQTMGYEVVRIPYFIQLTEKSVETLFARKVHGLFDENIPSLGSKYLNTPAFLCPAGIIRMATEFLKFPEQYKVNVEALKKENADISGVNFLEEVYDKMRAV